MQMNTLLGCDTDSNRLGTFSTGVITAMLQGVKGDGPNFPKSFMGFAPQTSKKSS